MFQENLCCVCKRQADNKKGKVRLCDKHLDRYTWDKDNDYLRQVKYGGKWDGIWPSQAKIAKILEKLGYVVDQEVRFRWCVSTKGVLLPYDIVIPEIKTIIEYQGIQHFEQTRYFFKRKDQWEKYLKRQITKKKLAVERGWIYVEITYKEDITPSSVHNKIKQAHEAVGRQF